MESTAPRRRRWNRAQENIGVWCLIFWQASITLESQGGYVFLFASPFYSRALTLLLLIRKLYSESILAKTLQILIIAPLRKILIDFSSKEWTFTSLSTISTLWLIPISLNSCPIISKAMITSSSQKILELRHGSSLLTIPSLQITVSGHSLILLLTRAASSSKRQRIIPMGLVKAQL